MAFAIIVAAHLCNAKTIGLKPFVNAWLFTNAALFRSRNFTHEKELLISVAADGAPEEVLARTLHELSDW